MNDAARILRERRLHLLVEIHKEEVYRIQREQHLTKYEAVEIANTLRIVRELDAKSDAPPELSDGV